MWVVPSLATSTENVAALEKEVADLHVDLEKMRSRGQAFREELALLKQDENKKAQESSTLSRSARKHKRSKPFDFDCDATSKSSDSCNEMSNPNQTVVGPSRKKRRTLEPPLENGNIYEEKQDRVVIDLENEVPRPPPGYEDGSRLLIDDGGEQNPVGEQTVEEAWGTSFELNVATVANETRQDPRAQEFEPMRAIECSQLEYTVLYV